MEQYSQYSDYTVGWRLENWVLISDRGQTSSGAHPTAYSFITRVWCLLFIFIWHERL